MDEIMRALYISLIIVSAWIEFSQKINTSNPFKKIALGLFIVGSMIHLGGHNNPLIEVGLLIYLLSKPLGAYTRDYFGYRKSRITDE